ncbi:MAG: phosphate signaling complex protein PhoU [Acidobacteriota bacterium]
MAQVEGTGKVREQILLMGARVEEMIGSSLRALTRRDSALARRVIALDDEIDRLELETDDLCLRLLARAPSPDELRFLAIALKLVTDLERIGDLIESICERVIELNQEDPGRPHLDLHAMATAAQEMVREALDAFVAGDAGRAERAIRRDSVVDAHHAQLFADLLAAMHEDPHAIPRSLRLLSIGKHLERIGDHATNVAELVIWMVRGTDVRHRGTREPQRAPRGVLFLCVQNSARSQMAEGWARKLSGVRVWSAGSTPAAVVHPLAVKVMLEAGVDISRQRPKALSDVPLGEIDTVVALCAEACPLPPASQRLERWDLPDPAAGDEPSFRAVRDELRRRIEALLPR